MITSQRLYLLLVLALLPVYGAARPGIPAEYLPAQSQAESAPASASHEFKVGVQIGHYKNNELPQQLERLSGDTGAFGGGRSEVDLNYDVANRVAGLLRAAGVQVDVLPATVPTGYAADAFVAIHADGSSSTAARGFKISTRWNSLVAMQDVRLVELLTDAYRSATGLPEDSAVTRNMRGYYAYSPRRPNYRVSNYTPGAIVEAGYMTNVADRAVLFKTTDKVAAGITGGIMAFLKEAYPNGTSTRSFGAGIVDKNIDPRANPTPFPTPRPNAPPTVSHGNWQIVLMSSKPTVNVYSAPGGQVIGSLPRDHAYYSTIRNGDWYGVTLPNGSQGWVYRNLVVVQMGT